MHRFVLFACLLALQEIYVSSVVVYFTDRIEGVIKRKCSNESIREEVLDELHHFIHCWQLPVPDAKSSKEEQYNQCIEDSKNFTVCLQEFVEKIEPCLEEKENYLPRFILDSYGNYNDHLCKFFTASGQSLTNIEKCQEKFQDNPAIVPTTACYVNSTVFKNNSEGEEPVISKKEVCGNLKKIRDCYERLFNDHCPESPEMQNLQMALILQSLEKC